MLVFIRRILVLCVVALAPCSLIHSQASNSEFWPKDAKRKAEKLVADKIKSIRSSNKLPPLSLVKPSREQRELVCSAAATGKQIHDSIGNLMVYVTQDLSEINETLTSVALGTAACQKGSICTNGQTRYPLGWKDAPRFSVVVERTPRTDQQTKPTYTVGVVRRPTAAAEFFAPITYDNPVKDANDWKEQVVSECRGRSD